MGHFFCAVDGFCFHFLFWTIFLQVSVFYTASSVFGIFTDIRFFIRGMLDFIFLFGLKYFLFRLLGSFSRV